MIKVNKEGKDFLNGIEDMLFRSLGSQAKPIVNNMWNMVSEIEEKEEVNTEEGE